MTKITLAAAALAALLPLAGCVETAGGPGGDVLASQGNLSPEAIRLQSQTQRLISLEQEQRNATVRRGSFIAQGAGIGALGGGGIVFLQCRLRGNDDCDEDALIGAAVGGTAGGVAGNAQANRQNEAAATENALRRRLQIAGQQLTTAQEARRRAQNVAAANQRTLSELRQQVASGQASREQLQLARADAQADAQAIRVAASAINDSAGTLDTPQLGTTRNELTKEEAATQRSYNTLIDSINRSAL